MRYVVGYVPNQRGKDAVALAATIAGTREVDVDIVAVLPQDAPTFDMYSPDRAFNAALEDEGEQWLSEALALVPPGTRATARLVRAESITEGLIAAAEGSDEDATEAGLIVVGAAQGGLAGRFTTGSVGDALLHSAPVPVALAPAGYAAPAAISRITCALGTRAGAEVLLDVAIATAAARGIPLRLVSLVSLGKDRWQDDPASAQAVGAYTERMVDRARATLAPDLVTSVVGEGRSLEEAAASLDFSEDELMLVGSSRLGGPRRIFLGASASKILRAVPVPVVVVPRDYDTGRAGVS